MLKQRILTALVLLAIFLPMIFAPTHEWLAAGVLVLLAAAFWEWARLNGLGQKWALRYAAAGVALCGVLWFAMPLGRELVGSAVYVALGLLTGVYALAVLIWVFLFAYLLPRGAAAWLALPLWLRLGFGLLLIATVWFGVAHAKYLATEWLLSVCLIPWVADIAAYFGGKAFGKREGAKKLAPTISPNKSWAGVYSGWVAVMAMAWVWAHFWPQGSSLFATLASFGVVSMLLAVSVLVFMSVAGDLIESLLKRAADVKDSSQLLPGHGGVLDRFDALLPVIPAAMLISLFV